MTDAPVFELERFTAAPVSGDVAVVEVEGRFGNGALNGDAPRLLVEDSDGERIELPALAPVSGPKGRWHASFAVPADRLTGNAFALALRDMLLDLPLPDTAGPDGDRLVALSRELNSLRRELDDARAHIEAEDARVVEAARAAHEDKDRALTEAAARMETALREARERHAGELKEAETAREHAVAALADERTRAERAEEERDVLATELRDAKRTLKTGRAEAEALRRERDTLQRELEAAQKVIPKGHEEPVEEPDEDDDAADPPSEAPTAPADGPVESVRVIGREGPRRVHPTQILPPVDTELPTEPPVFLGYIVAAVIFVIFVVVVTLLLI